MFDRRFNSSIRSCSVAFYNHYFQNTEHDVKNPRKDSLSECEIFEGFRNTLFVQSGRSNRCRLRSQFKPPITAVDYGLGRDSGDNNKGMATVVLSTTTLRRGFPLRLGRHPASRIVLTVTSGIGRGAYCAFIRPALAGIPIPPTPRSPGPEALG